MTENLLAWYRGGHRDLPWRRSRDPYAIWVSEIMLQQTRVETVLPYYERFLRRFPTVESLAEAPEPEVLACWSGLGYYSRARNLRKAARIIAERGGFPGDFDSIRKLPGVGDYTAAAIASIAFGLPHAVLDGNVLRVISRLENDASDIALPKTRERFRLIAGSILDARDPGAFNQALMELGATVCLPRDPLCLLCPVAAGCRSRVEGTQAGLPVKIGRKDPEHLAGTLVIARRNGKVLLWQRAAAARRMAGFWELPEPDHLPGLAINGRVGRFRHTITHHHYEFTVVSGSVRRAPGGFRWVALDGLDSIPLSTTARKALALAGALPGRP